MAKDSTTKTVLIVGAVGLGVFLLANKSIRDQLQETIAKLTAQLPMGGGGGGILPNINIQIPGLQWPLTDLTLPELNECYPELKIPNITDLIPKIPNLIPESGAATPGDHATALDVAYSLPTWAKGAMVVGATALGAYGGFQAIRISAPVLRTIGIQSARAIGGAGNILGSMIKTAVSRPAATVAARAAAPIATRAAGGGLLAGVLPGLALTGMMEGAYQIFKSITTPGAQQVGFTGVVPFDIINLIRGKLQLGPGTTPAPSLFDALFGGLFGKAGAAEPAAGGSPASVAPAARYYGGSSGADLNYSWCEAYNNPEPIEVQAARERVISTATTTATKTSYPAFSPAETQKLIETFETRTPEGVPAGTKVAQQARYAEAMRNLGY